MNAPAPAIGEHDLQAFVDGQLDGERMADVLAWLDSHADDAAKVRHWEAQRRQLRKLAREAELGQTPAALTETVLRAARRTDRRRHGAAVAAVLASLLIGAAGGYVAAGRGPQPEAAVGLATAPPAFVQEAVAAHAVYVPEKRHPVEVKADEEAHLVQWLSRRLGAPLKVPDLRARGYRLLGGRLLPGEGTPRAQFMYEDAQGTRLTLYVAAFPADQAPPNMAFRTVREGAEASFYWVEDRFGYALNGPLSTSDLLAVSRDVYRQLVPKD